MRVSVDIKGARELQSLMRQAPKDLQKDMRRTAKTEVGDPLAADAKRDAGALGLQAWHGAQTTRGVVSGPLPAIRVGGSRKAGVRGGATAGQLAPGTIFGSNKFRQFPARKPRGQSYWFFSSVDRHGPAALEKWKGLFDTLNRKWRNGG